jgi:hypothetical protein
VVIFVALALGHYRTARLLAALAIVPGLVALLQHQFTGIMPAPFGPWAWWVLVNLGPVAAMAAFHPGAPPAARWPWLLALPAGYLLVIVPLLALAATGNYAWLPDFSGRCCLLVALACLVHAPRAWSRRAAGSGVWSLALALLAAVAGAFRIATLSGYLHDPHLIKVSPAELVILVAAAALVAPDAVRAQAAVPRSAAPDRPAQQESSPAALPHTGPVWLTVAGGTMVWLGGPRRTRGQGAGVSPRIVNPGQAAQSSTFWASGWPGSLRGVVGYLAGVSGS